MRNDTPSESCRRDASDANLFGTDIIHTVETSTMENRPTGVIYTVVPVVYGMYQESYHSLS